MAQALISEVSCLDDARDTLKRQVCKFVEDLLLEQLGPQSLPHQLARARGQLQLENEALSRQLQAATRNGAAAAKGAAHVSPPAESEDPVSPPNNSAGFGTPATINSNRPSLQGERRTSTSFNLAASFDPQSSVPQSSVNASEPRATSENVTTEVTHFAQTLVDAQDAKEKEKMELDPRKWSFSLNTVGGNPRKTRLNDLFQRKSSRPAPGESLEGFGRHSIIAKAVKHTSFDIFFNFIIILNCATLGINAHGMVVDDYSDEAQRLLEISEQAFTALFTIELLLRLFVYGARSFSPVHPQNWGNFFDAILVVLTGIVPGYMLPLGSVIFGYENQSDTIQAFTVLRAMRLLRLVRVVQRVPLFHEAWLLLRGLTDSLRTLWWTCIVIFFITYIFAVFGLVLISRQLKKLQDQSDDLNEVDRLETILKLVGGLDVLMGSLIQVLTMDSWNTNLMKPIVHYLPQSWLYFYAYIAFAVFVLMNLVTAIIVDNAVSKSRMDEDQALKEKEKEKRKGLAELEDLFEQMDTDGNGTLSWDEFKAAFNDVTLARKWKLLDFGPEDCLEIFQLLDDGSGEIDTGEFFDGLARMKGTARSKDLFRLAKSQDQLIEFVQKIIDGTGSWRGSAATTSDDGGRKRGTSQRRASIRKASGSMLSPPIMNHTSSAKLNSEFVSEDLSGAAAVILPPLNPGLRMAGGRPATPRSPGTEGAGATSSSTGKRFNWV